MFEQPISYSDAERQLNQRLDRETYLKYKDILASWDAEARQRAFFSSRVAESSILSELHRIASRIVDGSMTQTQGRRLMREYFSTDSDALARLGFAPARTAYGISELASIPRIDLIFSTNVRMAQEVASYKRWQELKAFYPYAVWRCGYAEEHRQEHLARDGKVYSADHPIWTQSPPGGEFNCHCTRELLSQKDLDKMGITPEGNDSPFDPSSLGFDPSRKLQDPPLSPRTPPAIAEKTREKIQDDRQKYDISINSEENHSTLSLKEKIDNFNYVLPPEIEDTVQEQNEYNENKKKYIETRQWLESHTLSSLPDIRKKKGIAYELARWFSDRAAMKNAMRLKVSDPASITVGNAPDELSKPMGKALSLFNLVLSSKVVKNQTEQRINAVFVDRKDDREAYNYDKDVVIGYKNTKLSVWCHEFAHWLEHHNNRVRKACIDYLEYRCKGEKSIKLKTLYPKSKYKAEETCRKDKWLDAYTGKDYIDGVTKNRKYTEVLSTGIQRILENPDDFANKDPEHFKFVMMVMQGEI